MLLSHFGRPFCHAFCNDFRFDFHHVFCCIFFPLSGFISWHLLTSVHYYFCWASSWQKTLHLSSKVWFLVALIELLLVYLFVALLPALFQSPIKFLPLLPPYFQGLKNLRWYPNLPYKFLQKWCSFSAKDQTGPVILTHFFTLASFCWYLLCRFLVSWSYVTSEENGFMFGIIRDKSISVLERRCIVGYSFPLLFITILSLWDWCFFHFTSWVLGAEAIIASPELTIDEQRGNDGTDMFVSCKVWGEERSWAVSPLHPICYDLST